MSTLNMWFWRQMAVVAGLMKKDELALEYWNKINAAKPNDAHTLATLAHYHAALGRTVRAIELNQAALTIDGKRVALWYNQGFLQQKIEDHAAAIVSFNRALALEDKFDMAHYGKAISLIKLNQIEEAVKALKANTKLQPMSPYGWYQLAHAYHKLNDTERVVKTIKRLADFEPKVALQLQQETGIDAGVKSPFA